MLKQMHSIKAVNICLGFIVVWFLENFTDCVRGIVAEDLLVAVEHVDIGGTGVAYDKVVGMLLDNFRHSGFLHVAVKGCYQVAVCHVENVLARNHL